MAFASTSIDNCQMVDQLNEQVCVRCNSGFYLDQDGQICVATQPQFINCLQVSQSNNCMRCDCGYSLTEEGMCQITSPDHIGCEVINKSNICIRPKADYTAIVDNKGLRGVEYGRRTHCEIRNMTHGRCQQCHSGYFLNQRRKCLKSLPLANEFYSYYSIDGQIMSRDYQFVVGHNGVFQQIEYCIEQKGQDDLKSSICEKCLNGKVLNESRTACFKPPFLECAMVSNEDTNRCIECIDNNNFYLKTYEINDQQSCVPREQELLEKCLLFEQKSSACKLCAEGLILTNQGCTLLEINDQTLTKQDYLNLSNLLPEDCEYVDEKFICQSCKQGSFIDTNGKCNKINIQNCMIQSEDGCKKCNQFMYFYYNFKQCLFITNLNLCISSSGETNYCQKCVKGSVLNSSGKCTLENNEECFSFSQDHSCTRCNNLHYLDNQNCFQIKQKNCLMSDGIANSCLKCKKHYFLNQEGNCQPEKLSKDKLICEKNLFYTSIGENPECFEYTNQPNCIIFHNSKDECLECLSSFFIEEGKCKSIKNCIDSDGINFKCLRSKPKKMFANSLGRVEIMKKECNSNGMENICTSCKLNKDSYGIYFEEDCIPYYQIPLNQYECLHLKKKNDKYLCELCNSTMYPNEDGICTSIENQNCNLSNGRTKECILCQKFFQLDFETGQCVLIEKIFLNCEYILHQRCGHCQNLYYLKGNICLPISDPECKLSDGILDICKICNNNKKFNLQIPFNFCGLFLCEEYDLSLNQCLRCSSGFILSKSINFKNHLKDNIICIPKIINNCKTLDANQMCSKCEDGYYLIDIPQINVVCAKNYLDNCKDIGINGLKCVSCMPGYNLLSSGKCQEIKGCIEFNVECIKCQIEYFLSYGQCFKILHCEEQYNGICLKCQERYSLNKKINRLINEHNFSEIILEQCLKVLSCIKTNGKEGCLECKQGYQLKHFTCYKKSQELCVKYDSDNKCVECKNLFYLDDGECKRVLHNNCEISNGINNQCVRCQLKGFYLSTEQCQQIANCLVSNGVDVCVICEEGYFINADGKCIAFKIDNCKSLSLSPTLQILKKELDLKNQQLKDAPKFVNKETKNLQIYDSFPPIGCNQCDNSFYLKNFQECSLIDKSDLQNCLETNSLFPSCYVCQHGFYLKVKYQQNLRSCFQTSNKFIKIKYKGCYLFNSSDECQECYPNFYMDNQNRYCIERQRSDKCLTYHPTKDECLICKSGYILLSLTQHQKVCMILDNSEKVENCKIYKQNSNICQECNKFFEQEDFIEFVLKEEQNICEPVIDLMCHKIDPITKSCLAHYIPQCEEYGNNKDNMAECLKCHNGFYFDHVTQSCKYHMKIENCQIYNSQKMNSCLRCKPLYFLQYDHTCSSFLNPHCQTFSENQKGCSLCEDKYAIDSELGVCVLSQIDNCEIVKYVLENEQICIQCADNFIVINEGKMCLFHILDINCIELDEHYGCVKCKSGFFLTEKGDCVDLHSACKIQNCLKYDNRSSQDSIQCEQCHPNFSINSQLQCLPLDPDSEIESHIKKKLDINGDESHTQIILICLILICLFGLLWKLFKRKEQKKETDKLSIENQMRLSSNLELSRVDNDKLSSIEYIKDEFQEINVIIEKDEIKLNESKSSKNVSLILE